MDQGMLKPHGYKARVYDDLLASALDIFGAVEVAGPMWCGKTWTSLAYGNSVIRLSRAAVREVVETDPASALMGDKPHVIDEWQDVPAVWDAVRDAVDESENSSGSFILTGSSSLQKDAVGHSGAGRISKIRMNTMSLLETGESSGACSLAGLFEGRFEPQLVQQHVAPLASILCRGGWPSLQDRPAESAAKYLDSYLDAVLDVNMAKKGVKSEEAWAVARSLARNVGTSVKLETVASDAFGSPANEFDKRKASECIAALKALYIIDELAGWDAPIRSKSRLRTKPKYYFTDPSLAVALLQIDEERLIGDGQLFGMLFESLCVHDLAIYASTLDKAPASPLRYYRDADGLEVDAILELRDGRWAAFEIKLGENKVPEAAKNLNRLKRKISANPAARNPEPEFLAVLVGAAELARYDKENGVYVIPITMLGV